MIAEICTGLLSVFAFIAFRYAIKYKAELREARIESVRVMHTGALTAWKYDIRKRRITFLTNSGGEESQPIETMTARLHPDDVTPFNHFIEKMNKVVHDDVESITLRIRNKQDEYNFYKFNVQATSIQKGRPAFLIGSYKDITMKQIQNEMWQLGRKTLGLILNNIPIPIQLKEIDNDHRYVYWNKASTQLAGVDGIDHSMDDLLDHETAEALHRIDQQVINTGKPCYQQITFASNTGYQYEFIVHKSLIESNDKKLLLTACMDISETMQLQHQLENTYRQTELIINNVNSGLAYITTDYLVQWENFSTKASNYQYETYRKNEFCYQSAYGRSEPCEDCVMQRSILSKKTEQKEFLLANGSCLEVFATPILNHNNEVEGVVIRADDNTERKEFIHALQLAKEKAEESDRLKSAFLANMSHEIRTPLNAIVGFSSMLTEAENEETKREYNQIIASNNELLLQLIGDILDLSRIETGSMIFAPAPFDLIKTLDEIIAGARFRIRNNVELRLVHPYADCVVTLDASKLSQVINNFITNAIKFTTEGSITVTYTYANGRLQISVADTGVGITEDKIPLIFNRFEKLDSFSQGTGLGLPICQAIMEAQGGKIEVHSTPGKGSTFTAWFPCEATLKEKTGQEA